MTISSAQSDFHNVSQDPRVSLKRPRVDVVRKKMWSIIEEEALKRAVRRLGQYSWKEVSVDPEVAPFKRTPKELQSKWIHCLSPFIIKAAGIQKDHEATIQELNTKHPKQWATIRDLFAGIVLPGKPAGKYYSDHVIKNYFNSGRPRPPSKKPAFEASQGEVSEITDISAFDGLMLIKENDWD